MINEELLKISNQFDINGKATEITKIDSGHINKTYLVKCDIGKKYILQNVNLNVFPNLSNLMDNIKNVTEYIRKNCNSATLNFIKTRENGYIYDKSWRMQEFIENTKSYLSTEKLEIVKEAGKAAGNFQRQLNGFDTEMLYEIIPKFHDTPERVKSLINSINNEDNKNNRKERIEKAKGSIDFVLDEKRLAKTNIIVSKLKNKEIPIRVTHNDTKLSNILFDERTNKYITLIDFDTIMPGSVIYDFGEGSRSIITVPKKSNNNLNSIYVDMKRFEAYLSGFVEEIGNTITREELKLLPLGTWMMTYENAVRFLTDYLDGDKYFTINKDIYDHNLVRAKKQIEALLQIEINEEKMKGMINQYGL